MAAAKNAIIGRPPSMPGDESKLIRQVNAAALQRDPEERDAYLDAACAGMPDVRAHVAALLAAHAKDLDAPTTRRRR
jgi:hypothetical protein